jgi:hypothetical protein
MDKPSHRTDYSEAEVFLAATNMKTFGGHFANYIGSALLYADSGNRRRLVEAFPEMIEKYLSGLEGVSTTKEIT